MKQFALTLAAALVAAAGMGSDKLARGFENPPPSARPQTWWHWMNGNITSNGITADLEAMARVGVGGAEIFNGSENIPHGSVEFNSPGWVALVKHAASECKRLGLELCMANCAGWSSSGGPWNTPEHGMQIVVTSEKRVTGPALFKGKLAQPRTNLNCYRDIAALAFPLPADDDAAKPLAACDVPDAVASRLVDGNAWTAVNFRDGGEGEPTHAITLTFEKPFCARSLRIEFATATQKFEARLEASDDGKVFRTVKAFSSRQDWPFERHQVEENFPTTLARVYRLSFTGEGGFAKPFSIGEVALSGSPVIENLQAKMFLIRGAVAPDSNREASGSIDTGKIVNLTGKMAADGSLDWQVPAGSWVLLRVGFTPNGKRNHPAPPEATGLECDKLSKEAMNAHWAGCMGKVLQALGPLAGKIPCGLNDTLIDSYEVGSQNWTPGFEAIFKARCGYDLAPFLPVFAGRIVKSPEMTDRFLWDFRRVIADLFAENYAGGLADCAHRAGLKFSCEPYGNCPSDNLQYGMYADIPMSEFWVANDDYAGNARQVASVGHVFGKPIIGAESFTANPEGGRWAKDLYNLKALGDTVFCAGVNRIIYHRFAHQPWTDPARVPGMTLGKWGTHFERTETWWNQSGAWLKYQARCQYLLQQGRFIADAIFYCGEDAPNDAVGQMPAGYAWDSCPTAALKQMSVKDGRIVLPSGMSYRMLVLPRGQMSPELLKTIGALAKAGATVIGPKPTGAPGLRGYPASEAETLRLAGELWPNVIRDETVEAALKRLGLEPDFVVPEKSANVHYIHRAIDGAEVYFVSCTKKQVVEIPCSFRVAGKVPELWNAETGERTRAPAYRVEKDRTALTLRLEPAGSVFVVFRQADSGDHAVAVETVPLAGKAPAVAVEPLEIIKAEYGYFPKSDGRMPYRDVTRQIRDAVRIGQAVKAINALVDADPAPMMMKELVVDYRFGGADKVSHTPENGTLQLPAGAEIRRARYGFVSAKEEPAELPQTVDVTKCLVAAVTNGRLEVVSGNQLAGKDPSSNHHKELRVQYRFRGMVRSADANEGRWLMLPLNVAVPAPVAEVTADAAGRLTLEAWAPVKVEVPTAAGKKLGATVSEVPAPFAIAGEWSLEFPAGWGAPASVKLDRLVSWTAQADSGVKYFSGTAAYRKAFDWPRAKQPGERYVLDLGALANLAEVSLNGKPMPTLWKPPFRCDVTGALKPGANELVVRVTNLWPNRLIGDEQLPPDCEWEGPHLKEWPAWLLEGKPSPTGRRTFATWHHWHADDALLESGLFGPVCICTVKAVALE